jgi:hypothetical protein
MELNLTCQCRDDLVDHEPKTAKCTKCPCSHFDLIYGSYSEDVRDEINDRLSEYFTLPDQA